MKEIPCKICKKPTKMAGTGLCNNCWEVESRVRDMDMHQLFKILASTGRLADLYRYIFSPELLITLKKELLALKVD